jgi:phage virion morphogenesis protein
MNDFPELDARLDQLLAQMDAGGRRALARRMGTDLRRSQIARIRAQKNPDGSGYEPRRAQQKKGRIRRAKATGPMFRKLATARRLRIDASADGLELGFADATTGRIARVHHLGLRDRINRQSDAEAQYPERRLLGLSAEDRARLLDLALEALGSR